jgi:hypothetical protein
MPVHRPHHLVRLAALVALVAAAVAYPRAAHADVTATAGQGCGGPALCAADNAAWRWLAQPDTVLMATTCTLGARLDCTFQVAGRRIATHRYLGQRLATPCAPRADANLLTITEPMRGGCLKLTALRTLKAFEQGDMPAVMMAAADRWANAILTAPVGKLPTARHYGWGCSWVSTAPRSMRCHFDLTIRPGLIRRGWWDVRYQPKPPCATVRFEDRSGRLAFRNGCIHYGMRPDGFRRIPPTPDPAP